MDKLNPKDMKIALPSSKSDDHSLSSMSKFSQKYDKIPRKKKTKIIPEPLVTAPEVTQDQGDMEKMIKLVLALKDQNRDQYV